ncbi:hypothetical protein POM88_015323 [Heracleum sosnowskyi]|uniref:Glycosyltransferases n=1 Tax=Heracleum sosnowskyi TaxID=360622 RepID=A0AAD8INH3_9APIA|nr:hypothetical protein POM88_015323 [Heracleum sosnowskyi]
MHKSDDLEVTLESSITKSGFRFFIKQVTSEADDVLHINGVRESELRAVTINKCGVHQSQQSLSLPSTVILETARLMEVWRVVRDEKLDGIVMFADDSNMHGMEGPACNTSEQLAGWHTFDSLSYVRKSAKFIGDKAVVLPTKMEWAGFVLNSILLWEETKDKPEWVKDLRSVVMGKVDVESPLSMLKDSSVVKPLGSCGRKVMLWWLRVEARADNKLMV